MPVHGKRVTRLAIPGKIAFGKRRVVAPVDRFATVAAIARTLELTFHAED